MSGLTAVILAGGLGTRLRPLTYSVPKPMVEAGGRPFLEWVLGLLKANGITDIIMLVGYKKEAIIDYFGDGSRLGVEVRYSDDGGELLGTGGALRKARGLIDSDFVLVNGDTYLEADLQGVYSQLKSRKALAVFTLVEVEGAKGGYVTLSHDGRILSFSERKGSRGLVNAGYVVMSREVLDLLPDSERFSLEEDFYPELVRTGRAYGVVVRGPFFDIGTPEGLEAFRSFIAKAQRKSSP